MSKILKLLKERGGSSLYEISKNIDYDKDIVDIALKELVLKNRIKEKKIDSNCSNCSLKCNSSCQTIYFL